MEYSVEDMTLSKKGNSFHIEYKFLVFSTGKICFDILNNWEVTNVSSEYKDSTIVISLVNKVEEQFRYVDIILSLNFFGLNISAIEIFPFKSCFLSQEEPYLCSIESDIKELTYEEIKGISPNFPLI